jgi:uncharacterized membrane protein YphA (DoxX/SURF4 family)
MTFLILRIGSALTFIGHGYFVFLQKPQWIGYFTSVGISSQKALQLMPLIGLLDFTVAAFLLFKPIRLVLIWAFIWALTTALIRPIANESWFEFLERGSNFSIPLALLWHKNLPKNLSQLFQ